MSKIILASSSIYRQELLKRLPIKFTSTSPNINEGRMNDETFEDQARRLSNEKAAVEDTITVVSKVVKKGPVVSWLVKCPLIVCLALNFKAKLSNQEGGC